MDKTKERQAFDKKVDKLAELMQELIEEADKNGWSFNVSYMFEAEPARGDISYNGRGDWSYSNC